jgi:Winged helix-turn helix
MLRLLKSEECSNLGEVAQALGYSWRQCQRWFKSYREEGLEELLKSRVHERGRQELVTPEAFEELQEETMKRGRSPPSLRPRSSLESATASSIGTPIALANSSGDARSSSRRVVPATRRPTPKSRRPSKKLRRRDRADKRAPLPEGEAAEGFGLRRGAFFGLINWHTRR